MMGELQLLQHITSSPRIIRTWNLIGDIYGVAQFRRRCVFFLWLVAKSALPTNAKRNSCHLSPSAACPRCTEPTEDLNHLFRKCPGSRRLWSLFRVFLPPLEDHEPFLPWFQRILRRPNTIETM